ncbi:MAG TPA: EamA family transporter [Aggregatilinea sp.]|uniref:EamA family transporter n=1 Tax=Aggregatilinea sp. TaxID=2806333 RepID=UPI002C892ABD|nr:EamA family transporter [Aggregatilinea sp.]HML23999.1 EamA family transporter [Aggregatilinea sp.]
MSAESPVSSSSHLRAVLQALFVTFLWSTSWVLIKVGLEDVPALTFAGLRYVLAFLALLPVLLTRPGGAQAVRALTRRDWALLLVLGLIFYSITQGAQFLALERLPAITTSLMISFSAGMVALLGIFTLGERLTRLQWYGLALYLVGVIVYFYPIDIPTREVVGLGIALVCVLANTVSSVLGRAVNRRGTIPPLVVTVTSMGIGAVVMLVAGIAAQGLPPLSLQTWVIIAWLAVVNTALAFTLWNHTLRTLSAAESSVINNAMLIEIAALAWIFLGESLDAREIGGLALAGVGMLGVQVRQVRRVRPASVAPETAAVRADPPAVEVCAGPDLPYNESQKPVFFTRSDSSMASKEKILDLIERGFAQEEAFIADLSDEDRAFIGTLETWSAKDVIAHNAAWKSLVADIIAKARHGKPLPAEEELDHRNANFYDANKDKTWDMVIEDAGYAKNELAAQTRALTEEEMNDPAWAGATNSRPIWRRIVGNGYSHPLSHLVDYYAKHDHLDRAAQISQQVAETLMPIDNSADWQGTQKYNLACYYALAGSTDQALALLKEALTLNPDLTEWSKEDADLASLRDDPRYQALYTTTA